MLLGATWAYSGSRSRCGWAGVEGRPLSPIVDGEAMARWRPMEDRYAADPNNWSFWMNTPHGGSLLECSV